MKIIDILNKIANGEDVPKEIEYRNIIFRYDYYNQCYIQKNYDKYNDLLMQLSDHKGTDLNYEVEIIEEEKKIPEKLELILDERFTNDELQAYIYETQEKVNQVIDYLKSKGE